ncbi:PREDICTED: uncharacterized protein LOC109482960 [Branchiostoma belcheri]|uniref:Uncharacterized protein LOC109482960 n=1 Tax=Branchiostoma belcheri TaxID=7741 RepID=A0A6P5A573_BRABE|nr:PREDICTED: uncharacterized protein LOC109482960 [Branchiostoma belcheri]
MKPAGELKAEIDFSQEKGMVSDDLFAPPGMAMKVDIENGAKKANEADDMTQSKAFSYPMGLGGVLMNGCFGTGYVKGDPCYKRTNPIPPCPKMMEGCTLIGSGFDGRGEYSSASRRKSVVQRYCRDMRKYHGEDVPDTMSVHGIYDTEVTSYVFESREAYRNSLQQKAGVSFSGWGFQASVEAAWGGSSSSQKQSFMSLIECDIIRYEIFLDKISPDTLNLAFLRDFLSLPKNFIQGKAKLQDFIIRYGTHFIKSAKFGGSLRLFKTQEASKSESLESFAVAAQASYNGMFAAGGHYGRKESSASSSSSKESSTHLMVEGGEQQVASMVADFYTTNFKGTFKEWLKSVPTYPKSIQMFMGTMSELLNLNYKLLFPFDISDAADGCFSENLLTEEGTGRKFYEVSKVIIFDLPEDINRDIKSDTEAYVVYAENRWNCHEPGTSLHVYNSHKNGGSGDTDNKKVSCFGFVMTYNEDTGKFSVTREDQTASSTLLGNLGRNYVNSVVGRAEYISPLEHSQSNSGALASIVEAPCSVKWSNSYQIKPAEEGGRCLYFVAASKGDIFVVFSSIPRDLTTWYHLQISFQGVALYKGMKLVKYEGAKSARSLGDSTLFQPYFICMEEDMEEQRTYVKYGIGSDDSEKGLVYMVYLDDSPPLGIRFYSFGSGEADVEVMDARVIEGGATGEMECAGGTILQDGMCVENCHPECNGCIPKSPGSKLDTECRLCRHFSVRNEDGVAQCVGECPADMEVAPNGVTCVCSNFVLPNDDGTTECVDQCPPDSTVASDGVTCEPSDIEREWRSDGRCGPDFPAAAADPGECDPNSDAPCCSSEGYCGSTDNHCTCSGCKDYRPKWRNDWKCGPNFPAPGANPGQCDPNGSGPCCSSGGWCGSTADHCTCSGCIDYRPKWRSDSRCGPSYPAPGANPGQCNPDSDRPCCSTSGWCGNTAAHCTCSGCINYGPRQEKWRSDSRCGSSYPAPGANPGQCNPDSNHPCCSSGGWCGNTAAHCTCSGCIDYRPKKWRSDSRCGSSYPAPGANPGQCNPNGNHPCCSTGGWCGNTAAHCTCSGCIDYRPKKWRDDWKCGPNFPAPGANPGQCNPNGSGPCCSSGGWCGSTSAHCYCSGCIDYRSGRK